MKNPAGMRYPYICDASRMYCDRTNPRAHPSNILQATTCWSKPDLVDFHQTSQRMKAKTPSVAKEPNRKTLPINTEVPNNPRAALEIFLNLHSRKKRKRGFCWRRVCTRNPDFQKFVHTRWLPRTSRQAT